MNLRTPEAKALKASISAWMHDFTEPRNEHAKWVIRWVDLNGWPDRNRITRDFREAFHPNDDLWRKNAYWEIVLRSAELVAERRTQQKDPTGPFANTRHSLAKKTRKTGAGAWIALLIIIAIIAWALSSGYAQPK